MRSVILIFICVAIIAAVTAEAMLPCVACSREVDPVCATPTADNANGGPPRTFDNPCLVQAADCGYSKHQYTITHNGKCD
ncbi:hypothetical protein HA402_015035 [Bradysia odoriphaga]|nr:hypothetical protein HA402_015035 [Bradysia odoriphaga]